MRVRRSVSLFVLIFATLWLASFALANTEGSQPPATTGATSAAVATSAALSHARVVSLSMVQGLVAIRKPDTGQWVRATVNAPVEEGYTVATERNSFAEVQFENGSTLRIGEFSRIEFKQLALAPHRGHVNRLTLVVGVATSNVSPEKHDEYVVTAAGVNVTPRGRAEFRTDLKAGRMRVEVFNGHVLAADAKQSETVGKNHAVAYDYRSGAAFQEAKAIQRDGWDKWVQERDREADLAAYRRTDDPNNTGGLLYGWDDLVPFGGPFPDGSNF
jgi:hypothetical protein